MEPPKIAEIMGAIADESSLELFKSVAQANLNSHDLKNKINLTRKQYYSRLYRLTRCGLIKRRDNIYSLTTFGKILLDAEATVENALSNFWRIRAIDSLEVADGIPVEEHQRLVDSLIKDQGIKGILAK